MAKVEFAGCRDFPLLLASGARHGTAEEPERRAVCSGENGAVHKRLPRGRVDGQPLQTKVTVALSQQVARPLAADVGVLGHLPCERLPQQALTALHLQDRFALQLRVRAGDRREVCSSRERLGQLPLLGAGIAQLCERPKQRRGRLLLGDARSPWV